MQSNRPTDQSRLLASQYHERLDAISDRLDGLALSNVDREVLGSLRRRQDALRVQVRQLRKSRETALEDLEAGISLATEYLLEATAKLERNLPATAKNKK